jgi:hypothetical protein
MKIANLWTWQAGKVERDSSTPSHDCGVATAMVVAGAIVPLAAFTYEMSGSASSKVVTLVGLG